MAIYLLILRQDLAVIPGWPGILLLLPWPPECWYYKHVQPLLAEMSYVIVTVRAIYEFILAYVFLPFLWIKCFYKDRYIQFWSQHYEVGAIGETKAQRNDTICPSVSWFRLKQPIFQSSWRLMAKNTEMGCLLHHMEPHSMWSLPCSYSKKEKIGSDLIIFTDASGNRFRFRRKRLFYVPSRGV